MLDESPHPGAPWWDEQPTPELLQSCKGRPLPWCWFSNGSSGAVTSLDDHSITGFAEGEPYGPACAWMRHRNTDGSPGVIVATTRVRFEDWPAEIRAFFDNL